MVETIAPVGYGDRTGRWLLAVGLHAIGALAAALAFGALVGAAGHVLGAPWGPVGIGAVALVALAYAAREGLGLALPVPQLRRQVPDWWRSFFSWPVAASLYGAGLGVGFFTYLTNGGLVVVAVAALVAGRPVVGAAVVGAFGLARGLSPLVAWPVRTREAGTALVDRLAGIASSVVRGANAVALGAVAIVAAMRVGPVAATAPIGSVGADLAAAATALLAVIFAWAAVAKLTSSARWRRSLVGYGLGGFDRAVAAGVPVVEASVALLAVAGPPRLAAVLALVLLVAGSAAIVRARHIGGDRVACGCFGGRGSRDYRVLLARNAGVALVAAFAAGAPGLDRHWWPGAPAGDAFLPFALAAAALLVAVITARRAAVWLGKARA